MQHLQLKLASYLYRFATERSLSVDTTAAGGNASLMSLQEGLSR